LQMTGRSRKRITVKSYALLIISPASLLHELYSLRTTLSLQYTAYEIAVSVLYLGKVLEVRHNFCIPIFFPTVVLLMHMRSIGLFLYFELRS
jgi:hypothetical protein